MLAELNQIQTFDLLKTVITVLGPILGALIGAFSAPHFARKTEERTKEQKIKSTIFQIHADIKSILDLEEKRRYILSITEIILSLKSKAAATWLWEADISNDAFLIFKENLNNLGLLPPILQFKIVVFYRTLDSIILDIKPGGVLNKGEGGNLDSYENLYNLLVESRNTGESILQSIQEKYPELKTSKESASAKPSL